MDPPRAATRPDGAVLLLGALVVLTTLASSGIAVALPALAVDLRLGTASASWVLIAFSLGLSVSTAFFGRLGDLRGLRYALALGVVLLSIGALLAAVAGSFWSLVLARLLEGVGVAAVPVLGPAVLAARHAELARERAIGKLTAVATIASGCGPLLAGSLAGVAGWRLLAGAPAVAVLLLGPLLSLVPSGLRRPERFDLSGALIVAATVIGALLLLELPQLHAGTPLRIAAVLAFAGGVALLPRHLRRNPAGYLPRALLSNRPFMLTALTSLTLFAAYLSMLLAVPVLLHARGGWSSFRIGAALLPAAALGALSSRAVGRWGSRLGNHAVAAALALGSAAGLLLVSAAPQRPAALLTGMGLVAAGLGGGQVALLNRIPAQVDSSLRGGALGTFNLLTFFGGALGVAVASGVSERLSWSAAAAVVAVFPLAGAVLAVASKGTGAGRPLRHGQRADSG